MRSGLVLYGRVRSCAVRCGFTIEEMGSVCYGYERLGSVWSGLIQPSTRWIGLVTVSYGMLRCGMARF